MKSPASGTSIAEIQRDDRFAFGQNWSAFLRVLDDDRINEAVSSLRDMLGCQDLDGLTFLDVGSGSGLFSLAAVRLGAERVHSFDYDTNSVGCTNELRRLYGGSGANWKVEHGSALDAEYLSALGRFDVVYSWGVLHHTGDMWSALENATSTVADGGRLFIAIYNDQGVRSLLWRGVKRLYNALPPALRLPFTLVVMVPREVLAALKAVSRGRPFDYIRGWTNYKSSRGMSRWHDLVDWVGGYPFEVATPDEIFEFVRDRGFDLDRIRTCGGRLGCNEYVFVRSGRTLTEPR